MKIKTFLTVVLALLLMAGVMATLPAAAPVGAEGPAQYSVPCYMEQGGAKFVASSGCEIELQSGATFDLQSGATTDFSAGVDLDGADLTIDADGDSILDENTDDAIRMTLGAATGTFSVLTGNFKVGNGTPTVTQDGEDAYIEGQLEVDGEAQFDGAIDANGAADIAGNITDADSAVTFADNAMVDGAADAVQLTVQGYATQTNDLLVLEQSDGTDEFTVDNDGNVDATGGINYGADDLYPLGYASADKEIVCGTATFTGTQYLDLVSSLTGVDYVLATQVTDPAAGGAFLTTSAPATATFTLLSWEDDYTEGTVPVTVNYCAVGDQ